LLAAVSILVRSWSGRNLSILCEGAAVSHDSVLAVGRLRFLSNKAGKAVQMSAECREHDFVVVFSSCRRRFHSVSTGYCEFRCGHSGELT